MKFCNPTPVYRHSLYLKRYHAHNPPLIQSTETLSMNPERQRYLFAQ